MSLSYEVAVRFKVEDLKVPPDILTGGSAGKAAVDHFASRFAGLKNAASDIGSKMSDAFTGAVEKTAQMAATFAKMGAMGVIAIATYGVAGLNNQLEQTQISLASIFHTPANTFAQATSIAADQMAKMKNDIKTLPGDLGQLSAIMTSIATPGEQAHMSPNAIREMAGRSMLVGRIRLGQQYSSELVAKDMALLLSGRAGAHNVLGTRLGLVGEEAKSFNKSNPEERASKLKQMFFSPEMEDAAKAFADTWVASSTTFVDNLKYGLLAPATAPLFESIKKTMQGMNSWYDANKGAVDAWANNIAYKLRDAFEWGKTQILEWWPAVSKFAEDAFSKISEIWTKIEPAVVRVANALKASLSNGDALDKIEKILKLYAGLKIGGAIMPLATSGMGMMGDAMGGAGGMGGMAMLTEALPVLLLSFAALGGAMHDITDETNKYHDSAVDSINSIKESFDMFTKGNGDLISEAVKAADAIGALTLKMAKWDAILLTLPDHIEQFWRSRIPDNLTGSYDKKGNWHPDLDDMKNRHHFFGGEDFTPTFNHAMNAGPVRERDNPLKDALSKLKIHQVINQTINMSISSNQEPSRIARHVRQKLAEVTRYPTASPFTPNWTSGRLG